MALLAMLRTQLSYWRGQRPSAHDLERTAAYMRRRRERQLPALPFDLDGRLRQGGWRDPERLRAMQLRRLRRTVEYVHRYVPYYRQALDAAGVKPSDIRSLSDVRRLPITRRDVLCENAEALISRQPGLVPTIIDGTSGTTGRPLRVYLTSEELRYYVASGAVRALLRGWPGPNDIVQTHRDLNNDVGGILHVRIARLAGALVLTLGARGTLDDHLKSLFEERCVPGKKPRVSVLATSPSHLWALTRRAEQMGLNLRESGLQQIRVGGAMVSKDLREWVLDAWGIRLHEGYGLVDTFTCAASQCSESDRLHFPDTSGYAEVLDPKTEEPVTAGEPGVLLITSFYPQRELMPVLRYWTDDLVTLSPDPTCVCGQVTTQILGIVGRVDHMVIVGPYNYYPQPIGDSLLAFGELVMPPRFTLRTEQRQEAQYAILDIEMRRSLSPQQQQDLRQRIEQGIILSHNWEVGAGSVKLVVNLRPAGSIEQPFPYKMQVGGGPVSWVQRAL